MKRVALRMRIPGLASVSAVVLLAGALAWGGGPTFSIDYQGPTIGVVDSWSGVPINEGDVLAVAPFGSPAPGPLPPPGTVIPAGPPGVGLGLASWLPGGYIPGSPKLLEVDALSYGMDAVPRGDQGLLLQPFSVFFSVDEFASGALGFAPPDVFSEGSLGFLEASADVFSNLAPLAVPVSPGGVLAGSAALDGNGIPPWGGPGVGLIEPSPPTLGSVPDPGDNMDALDIDTVFPNGHFYPVYFSLDSAFPDPLEAAAGLPPPNTGSAAANGFVGGDVLVTTAFGGPPVVYAAAITLGLDLAAGADSDDLDALAVWDDGDGWYDPTIDLVAFSVRRGSALIGIPDSIWGAPIEPGDILVPPGAAGGFPGILIPAEALGLDTARSGLAPGDPFGADDLDALDFVPEPATAAFLVVTGLTLALHRRQRG